MAINDVASDNLWTACRRIPLVRPSSIVTYDLSSGWLDGLSRTNLGAPSPRAWWFSLRLEWISFALSHLPRRRRTCPGDPKNFEHRASTIEVAGTSPATTRGGGQVLEPDRYNSIPQGICLKSRPRACRLFLHHFLPRCVIRATFAATRPCYGEARLTKSNRQPELNVSTPTLVPCPQCA